MGNYRHRGSTGLVTEGIRLKPKNTDMNSSIDKVSNNNRRRSPACVDIIISGHLHMYALMSGRLFLMYELPWISARGAALTTGDKIIPDFTWESSPS